MAKIITLLNVCIYECGIRFLNCIYNDDMTPSPKIECNGRNVSSFAEY